MKDLTKEELEKKVQNLRKAVSELTSKVRSQKRVLKFQDEAIQVRNLRLDALGWIWCHGACGSGYNRYDQNPPELTLDMAKEIINHAVRVKRRFLNENCHAEGFRKIEDVTVKNRMTFVCPHCESPVQEEDYEKLQWNCPKCGTVLTTKTLEQKAFIGPYYSFDRPHYIE